MENFNQQMSAGTQANPELANMMASYFMTEAKKSASKSNKTKQQPSTNVINLSTDYTLGTVVVKPIYDSVNVPPIPTRTIYSYYDVRIPYQPKNKETGELMFNDNGDPVIYTRRVRFMDPNNYKCTVTPEQNKLYEEVVANLTKWDECKAAMENSVQGSTSGSLWYEYRKQLTIFWGYLVLYTDKSNNDVDRGGIKLFRTHASDFIEKFSGAIQNKSKLKGSNLWISDYLNRAVGTQSKAVQIVTDRPTFGYETTVTFDECQPFEVKAEDLESVTDINAELVDANFFDEDALKSLNNELLSNITAYTNSARSNFGQATQPIQPQVNNLANQAVPQQQMDQPVVQPTQSFDTLQGLPM